MNHAFVCLKCGNNNVLTLQSFIIHLATLVGRPNIKTFELHLHRVVSKNQQHLLTSTLYYKFYLYCFK